MQTTQVTVEQFTRILVKLKLTRLINSVQVLAGGVGVTLAAQSHHGGFTFATGVVCGILVLEGLYHSWAWPL